MCGGFHYEVHFNAFGAPKGAVLPEPFSFIVCRLRQPVINGCASPRQSHAD